MQYTNLIEISLSSKGQNKSKLQKQRIFLFVCLFVYYFFILNCRILYLKTALHVRIFLKDF